MAIEVHGRYQIRNERMPFESLGEWDPELKVFINCYARVIFVMQINQVEL